MVTSRRWRIEPTHQWDLLVPLFEWPEQERYEQIRPLVLFDASVAQRAAEIGTSAGALYRRLDRFAEEGMESLFDAPKAKRSTLPPAVRRLVVDLRAEYPTFNLNELANVVGAPFGSKPDVRKLLGVGKATLFETPFAPDQMRLFGLAETLGDEGWLKALELDAYAPRTPRRSGMLQQILFSYADAV